MRRLSVFLSLGMLVAIGAATTPRASSHREAPLISQDPLADNTDTYAFVSPASPDKVVLIANYIPLEAAYGGPNFFKFDDNVLYEIMVDNTGDAVEDIRDRCSTRQGNGNARRRLNRFCARSGIGSGHGSARGTFPGEG